MKFSNDEMKLMCIYDAGTGAGLMRDLYEMQTKLGSDKTEFLILRAFVLKKLSVMTCADYDML